MICVCNIYYMRNSIRYGIVKLIHLNEYNYVKLLSLFKSNILPFELNLSF